MPIQFYDPDGTGPRILFVRGGYVGNYTYTIAMHSDCCCPDDSGCCHVVDCCFHVDSVATLSWTLDRHANYDTWTQQQKDDFDAMRTGTAVVLAGQGACTEPPTETFRWGDDASGFPPPAAADTLSYPDPDAFMTGWKFIRYDADGRAVGFKVSKTNCCGGGLFFQNGADWWHNPYITVPGLGTFGPLTGTASLEISANPCCVNDLGECEATEADNCPDDDPCPEEPI